MKQLTASAPTPLRTGAVALLVLLLALLGVNAPTAAASTDQKVTGGTLTWGVKASFRTYMTGFIANGTITADDKAHLDEDEIATFVEGSGTVRDGKAEVSYKGAVHYYGHDGELDFTLSDPKLTLDPKGTGHLEFGYAVAKDKPKRVVMADVDSASLTPNGTKASVKDVKTHLAKAGMDVFSYKGHPFYDENTELDPVSAELQLDGPASTSTPSSPSSPTSSSPTTSKPSSPATSKPSSTPPAKAQPASSTSSLTWGVKASFRSYIASPVAHGRITVSQHASASSSGFTFPQRSTTAKPPSADGTTQYTGSVNFYGHDGVLDVTFSNPRVVIGSGSNAQLVVDYAQNGKPRGSLPIASLNLAGGQKSTSDGSVSYRGVPANLTQQGVAVFSYEGHGFYPAGIALDPVSFTIGSNAAITGSGSSSVVTGSVSSPATGASNGSTSGTNSGVSGAPAASSDSGGAGVLLWGVRSSFRSYILGPIAHGSITVGGGASNSGGVWAFPQNGQKNADGGAPYRGSVKFYGHSGILDLTFSNPTVRVTSPSSAVLSVTVNGRTSDMVTLDLSRAGKSTNGGATTYTGAPATLTSAGAGVFSYQGHAFYPPGSAMDPVTFTVGSPSSAQGASSTTASGSTGLPGAVGGPGGGSSSGSPKAALPEQTCSTTGTDLTWGFKESFRSYIKSSITNGDWTTMNGAAYRIPNFVWSKGDGKFGKDGKQGTVKFPGAVHFTGHDGALDATVSNPVIEFTGDKAYLRLDVKSTLMDAALQGNTQWYTRNDVRFVELDMSRISIAKKGDGSAITGSSVPAKLTADGASAFPEYTAGTAMDPVSFTMTTSGDCVKNKAASSAAAKPKKAGPRAVGGSDEAKKSSDAGMMPWLGGGALGLAGITAGSLIARRRTPSTVGSDAGTGIEDQA